MEGYREGSKGFFGYMGWGIATISSSRTVLCTCERVCSGGFGWWLGFSVRWSLARGGGFRDVSFAGL